MFSLIACAETDRAWKATEKPMTNLKELQASQVFLQPQVYRMAAKKSAVKDAI